MKIALIGMSGVRAEDQELMALGLTLPGFVERSRVIASLPSLSLLTLAGMTPKGHEVRYLESRDVTAESLRAQGYELVALSTLSAQAYQAYALADALRAKGTRVVLGGLHVTAVPDDAQPHADALVVGEGEPCWPELLRDAEAGRLKPRYHGKGFSLAEAPMPAFELLDLPRYNRLTVQTARGCPLLCEFCASSILLTPGYQQKPIARVLAEVDRIRELWRHPFLELADDNSFVRKAYWKALLPQLGARRLHWFAETDISVADDPELLRLLREAGCVEVLIGLESPVVEGLQGLELRSDFKLRRFSRSAAAVRRIQAEGIRVNGCFILGLDGHTPAVFDAVFRAVDELELFDVQVTVQTPFPGTPLYERLLRTGRILAPGAWERCTLFDVNFVPSHMTPQELRGGLLDLSRRLYAEDFTDWRRRRFRARTGRGAKASAPGAGD